MIPYFSNKQKTIYSTLMFKGKGTIQERLGKNLISSPCRLFDDKNIVTQITNQTVYSYIIASRPHLG